LLGRKISRLGESTPESTLAPGASSPGRLYPRLSELLSGLGENSPESILATRNHSRLGELCRKISRIHYIRVTMHALDE